MFKSTCRIYLFFSLLITGFIQVPSMSWAQDTVAQPELDQGSRPSFQEIQKNNPGQLKKRPRALQQRGENRQERRQDFRENRRDNRQDRRQDVRENRRDNRQDRRQGIRENRRENRQERRQDLEPIDERIVKREDKTLEAIDRVAISTVVAGGNRVYVLVKQNLQSLN